MPFAHNGTISQDPIEGGIEISQEQYQEALTGMLAGRLVSVGNGFAVIDHPEPEPEPEQPEPPKPQPKITFSSREFLKQFTMAEYAAARTHTNIGVQWALDNLIGAQFVDINDLDTIAGMAMMVSEGVVTPERRDEILTPQAA